MNMFDPAHPGELLRETLESLREETGQKFSIREVAEGLDTTRKNLSAIINGKQTITPDMALRLGKAFTTTAEFWLQAQENYNLAQARKTTDIAKIRVFWQPART